MWNRRRFLGAMGAAGTLAACRTTPRTLRTVSRVVPSARAMVGEIFRIQRTIPGPGLDQVDPFMLLDHFDFALAPGQRGGLAPHPHKGIETVTVLLEGAIEHGDSLGNRAVLEGGGVQWMTAGEGIVHEENPAEVIRERGGRIHGVQLWVNLPRAQKGAAPGYQDKPPGVLPEVVDGGSRVRVLAGSIEDVSSPIRTRTPLALHDAAVPPRSELVMAMPDGWTGFVHVVEGQVEVAGTAVAARTMALLTSEGDGLRLVSGDSGARILLGGGRPIAEPYARRGPFVMNTEAELEEAWREYRAGEMGRVANPTYERIRLNGG